jgi:hypothetical protein
MQEIGRARIRNLPVLKFFFHIGTVIFLGISYRIIKRNVGENIFPSLTGIQKIKNRQLIKDNI